MDEGPWYIQIGSLLLPLAAVGEGCLMIGAAAVYLLISPGFAFCVVAPIFGIFIFLIAPRMAGGYNKKWLVGILGGSLLGLALFLGCILFNFLVFVPLMYWLNSVTTH